MNYKGQIESLLFISHKPLNLKELSRIIKISQVEVQGILNKLIEEYNLENRGIKILKLDDKYQMAINEKNSGLVSEFLKIESIGELTRPSLETLTIIAYKGPVSKTELELIRGVNCSLILKNLLIRGLIDSTEDKNKGVTVYQITMEFLKHLGLNEVGELPDFEKLNSNNNLDKLLQSMSNNQ